MTVSMEVWRPVVGYEGLYAVSSLGNVRSIRSSRLLSPTESDGYLLVTLCGVGRQKRRLVSGIVCEAFHGPRPPGHHAGHRNGDKKNNSRRNVQWITPVQNAADKVIHGTAPIGEKHGGAKLTEKKVLEIRRRSAAGASDTELARAYAVSRASINFIKRGVTWSHVST